MMIICLLFGLFSTPLFAYPGLYSVEPPLNSRVLEPIAKILAEHKMSFEDMEVSSYVGPADGFCWGFYYIDFVGMGDWQGEPWQIRLSIQVDTQENLDRLFPQVEQHFPNEGFPQCMIERDLFYMAAMELVQKWILYVPKLKPSGICAGMEIKQPISACYQEENLYGPSP